MAAYYNEIDPHAAQWLRNLIAAGHIAPGDVDTRSIVDVCAADLAGYSQCHFFAGIGGWSLALRIAGWGNDRPVWTGSCPCQPFSHATNGHGGPLGRDDERHLWPAFRSLIAEHGPADIFGEQVASSIGHGWLDEAFTDLETEGYACGAVILPANAFGAKHQRERLVWVAHACGARREGSIAERASPFAIGAAQPLDDDPLAAFRRAVDGGDGFLLPSDGLPPAVERLATKGYGNAIVPQVAAEVIAAYMECRP